MMFCFYDEQIIHVIPFIYHAPYPCPQATTDLLSVSTDFPILDFDKNEIIQYATFCHWLFHLAECFQGSSTLQYVLVPHSFLWPVFHCVDMPHLVYPSIDGHLGCFRLQTVMNNAAMFITSFCLNIGLFVSAVCIQQYNRLGHLAILG